MRLQQVIRDPSGVLLRLRVVLIVLLGLLGIVLAILAVNWPFTQEATIRSLEQVSASVVKIGRYEKVFFPHPGYIASDVTFSRESAANSRPLGSIGKLTCRASWHTLLTFTHTIARMDLERVHVYIPAHVPPSIRKHPDARIETTVTELFANGAVLEIAPRHEGSPTERFKFPELALSDVAKDKAIRFRTLMLNPNLVGQLRSMGTVGPLVLQTISETKISGDYHLRYNDLSRYKILAGTLSADGRFSGTLGHADISGRAGIPNFEVSRSGHSLGLTAEFNAVLDAIRGDVTVRSADAHFLRTTVVAQGSIAGQGSKTLSLDIYSRQARVEDLLRLFVKAGQPPLDGALQMHAHVTLPPKHEPFLKRVQLVGSFAINGAEFTKRATEEKLCELSIRARGEKNAKAGCASKSISAEFKSDVALEGGVATLSGARFVLPGAVARGGGTFSPMDEAIDLHGKLAMRASLSKAAGGLKSVLLVPLDPFFKKDGAGAVLPVHVKGTYSHPIFSVR